MVATVFPPLIDKATTFMPGLVSSLNIPLEEKEALILSVMVHNGGTITKAEIVEFLNITRPTRDKYVYSLLDKELIIQNEAVAPIRLTLTAHVWEQLRTKLQETTQHFEAYKTFLVTVAAQLPRLMPSKLNTKLKERLISKTRQAMRSLTFAQPFEDLIREILVLFYEHFLESGQPLVTLSALKRTLEAQGHLSPRESKTVLQAQGMFRLFSFTQDLPPAKQKMKSTYEEVFIRPRKPLETIIEDLAQDTNEFLDEYTALLNETELAIIPYQILRNRRWIRNKIRFCLSVYSEVFIMDNGIYVRRDKKGILGLINQSGALTNKHSVWYLTNREVKVPEEMEEQVVTRLLLKGLDTPPDYDQNDVVLFLKEGVAYGCIKFPRDKRLKAYYEVTHHRVNSIKEQFKELWRKVQLGHLWRKIP